ncbi:hypothetical protein [Arthrobacter sp. KBS0703]|nr:hypothetical protein [Arthrobacter sp. KBS0703]
MCIRDRRAGRLAHGLQPGLLRGARLPGWARGRRRAVRRSLSLIHI